MKKSIIIVLFCASLFASAQKNTWTIGFYSGIQGQLFITTEHVRVFDEIKGRTGQEARWLGKRIHTISDNPSFELTVQYKITDYSSLISGIRYGNYLTQWDSLCTYSIGGNISYPQYRSNNLQIPLVFQYDIPLKRNFSLFGQLGLYFDFLTYLHEFSIVPKANSSDIFILRENIVKKEYKPIFSSTFYAAQKMNLLVHLSVGSSYQFNSGIGLSLSVTHKIGVLYANEIGYTFQLKDIYTDTLIYTLDYFIYNQIFDWNVLLGVTYTFK